MNKNNSFCMLKLETIFTYLWIKSVDNVDKMLIYTPIHLIFITLIL